MTRQLSAWWCLLVGIGSAVLGLLPWLVTGARLPLQNLWATDTASVQLPRVLLPFSQYAITLLIGIMVTGGATAGLCVRAVSGRLTGRGVAAAIGGVLFVQLGALGQTTYVVHAGLQERRESTLYLAVLIAVTSLSILVSIVVLGLIARGSRAAVVIGLSIAALGFGPWLSGLLIPFGTISPSPIALALLGIVRWVPAIVIGVAIGWSGISSAARATAAALGLLLLWTVPALTTAISTSAGSRVLAHRPAEMAQYGVEVFGAAVRAPGLVLPPIILALAVAAGGLLVRRLRPATSR